MGPISKVTQVYRAVGSWEITFENLPQELVDQLDELGHIVVTQVREQGPSLGDNLLSAARYTGVVRARTHLKDEGRFTLDGPGLEWWLGTEDKVGAVYETAKTYSGATFSAVITDLLPASITAGTLTNGALPTYTGTHQWVTPREAIDYVCDTVGAVWRVRPNGTLDAGPQASVFAAGRALIVRRPEDAGDDMSLRAFPGPAEAERDVEDFTTRVVVLGKVEDDTVVQGDWDIAGGLNPYKDLHGNTVDLTRIVSESSTEGVNADARAEAIGEQYENPQRAITLDSIDYDFRGVVEVGDMVWIWDPDAGLVDANNEVQFRGKRINPISQRVTSLTWPVTEGMGVYYRSRLGAWLDLSRWLVAESESTTVEVGKATRELVSSGEVPTGRVPEPDTSVPNAPTFTTPFRASTYAQGDTGVTRAQVQVAWTAPLTNTDSSPFVDGSHYEIGYRPSSSPDYPATYAQAAAAGPYSSLGTWGVPVSQTFSDWQTQFAPIDATTSLISELPPGTPIEFRIRVLDSATPPNASAWSSSYTQYMPVDVQAPNVPAAPVVAGSKIAVLVKHYLGDDGGGTFNLAQDLAGLKVYIGTTSTFTVDKRSIGEGGNLAGRIVATKAQILGQIPVMGTFPVDTTSPLWVRVSAYDLAGNESEPSAAAPVTAELIDDQWISNLTVDKLTSGTMTASVILGGEIATAPAGAQRVRMGSDGIEAYLSDGVTKFLDVDISTQTLTAIGEFRTAPSGTRLVMNPAGTDPDRINFYPSSGGNVAYLYTYEVSGQANLVGRGNSTRGDGKAGEFGAWPLEGYVRWVAAGVTNPNSSFTARETEALMEAAVIKFQRRDQYSTGGDNPRRCEWLARDGSNNVINASVLYLQSASGNEPWFQAPTENSGIGFATNTMTSLQNGGNFGAIAASQFNVNSSEIAKTLIRDLDIPGGRARDLMDGRAPARMWKYRADIEVEENWPDKPGGRADEHELEWSGEPFRAPWHVGPMAEDLPAWMVGDLNGRAMVNIDDKVGVLWRVCEEQETELRALRLVVDRLAPGPVVVDGEVA